MIRIVHGNYQRKFGSQTSHNMDRWGSRSGKSQRREEQKKEDQRRERIRGKKMQVREKGREVKAYKHTPCSEHFWKLRCRKSARRCGAKHVSKSKCAKHHVRSTVGNRDVEIVHAVLARSKFPSQNVQNTSCSEHLGSEMSKKCTPLWRAAHFQVKMLKRPHVRTTFGRSDVVSRGRRKVFCTVSKESKTQSKTSGFCGSFDYNHQYTTLHSTPLQLQLQLQLSSVFSGGKKAHNVNSTRHVVPLA